MEHRPVSAWKSSLNYGLFLGIALVLVSLVYYSTGDSLGNSATFINNGITIAGIIIAQLHFRKHQGGYMSYSQAFGVGILTMIFASVITGFFAYLLYAVIDPSLQDKLLLSIEEKMVSQGNIPESQLDMVMNIVSIFKNPAVMFFMNIFGGAFIGLFISLITSIFTHKNVEIEI